MTNPKERHHMDITLDHCKAIATAAEDAGLARCTPEPECIWVLGPELTALRERMSGKTPRAFSGLTVEEAQAMEDLIGMNED
jgi:hypothetical protein